MGGTAVGYSKAIYFQQAPETAEFPCVIFNKSSGIPVDVFGDPPATAMDNDVWLFKAVDRSTTADTAEQISDRITQLLHGTATGTQKPSVSGGTILYLRRESDVQYAEVTDGQTFQHVGALYRVAYGTA